MASRLREYFRSFYEIPLGIYSVGFSYIISRAPHPDSFLPIEIGFFVLMGGWFLAEGVYKIVKTL